MNYNSKTLLDVKFAKNVKGYDALEVDEALDEVIEDYKAYEKKSIQDSKTIEDLKKEIEKLKKANFDLNVENKKLQKVVDSIPESENINRDNIVYLRRISELEKALYKKGVDPKKI